MASLTSMRLAGFPSAVGTTNHENHHLGLMKGENKVEGKEKEEKEGAGWMEEEEEQEEEGGGGGRRS